MFNTDKESYFSSMDKYGIQISAMGDIMIDEIMMMRLQEMVGLDIRDGDSLDTDKVLQNAEDSGFTNLGGFGGRSCSQEDNYVFHMDNEKIISQEKVDKLVEKAFEVGDSYMELGYYLEDKTYELEVEYGMLETVKVTAKSKQEAIDTFLNDVASYSELGKLAESDYYDGISNITVKSEEGNFLD